MSVRDGVYTEPPPPGWVTTRVQLEDDSGDPLFEYTRYWHLGTTVDWVFWDAVRAFRLTISDQDALTCVILDIRNVATGIRYIPVPHVRVSGPFLVSGRVRRGEGHSPRLYVY